MNSASDTLACSAGAEDGWLPIREVARLTGVNPVTLRAWERRHGLIVPHRTPKGHRLYNDKHVQRIRRILDWLERGVAVGQVSQLLDAGQAPKTTGQTPWSGLQQDMLGALEQLAERQLDDLFNQALALYPPRTLCQHLLLPLLATLDERCKERFGGSVERGLFYAWLRTKLGTRIYHSGRQHSGTPLLVISLDGTPGEPGPWLCAWLAVSAGCPVQVIDSPLSLAEVSLALERTPARGLLLYASRWAVTTDACREMQRIAKLHDTPLILAGPAARLAPAASAEHPGIALAEDPLAVLPHLQACGLLDDEGYLE